MTVGQRWWMFTFTVLSMTAYGEQVSFHNLTTDMGLSHGDVVSTLIDSEGYIWAGTADGLNKYDGVGFTIYKTIEGDSTSLPSNYINCLYEDSHKTLWLGLNDYLVRYDRDTDRFVRYPLTFGSSVSRIFEDTAGNLWLGCMYGVYIFDRRTHRMYNPFELAILPEDMASCASIVEDSKGTRWMAFQRSASFGLLSLDANNHFRRWGRDVSERKLRSNLLSCLMVDRNDNVWIGYYDRGIDIIEAKTGAIKRFEPDDQHDWSRMNITKLIMHPGGRILIGTGSDGLLMYDPLTNQINQSLPRISDRGLLSSNVTDITVCKEGITLIGCWGGGISLYDKRFNRFQLYRQGSEGLHGNSVTCFSEDDKGFIWVATDGGGLNRFDPVTEKFTHYKHQLGQRNSLASDKVLAVLADKPGNLWVGYWQEGLSHFKVEGDQLRLIEHYPLLDPNNSTSHSVFKLTLDQSGQLWVGSFSTGAYRYESATNHFVSLPESRGNHSYNSVFDIYPDVSGGLWFASDRIGLMRMDTHSHAIHAYPVRVTDGSGLLLPGVNVLFEDSRQRMWAGGDENGLYLINPKTGRFNRYTVKDGLSDNSIQGILEDGRGNLWLSSRLGLTKVSLVPGKNPERPQLVCTHYSTQDGLQGRVFNRWSYFKSRSGELYFGGQNGFNVFLADSIVPNDLMPPVHLTGLLIDNKPIIIGAPDGILTKHISKTTHLNVLHKRSSIRLRFIALNYFNSQKNQYAYKLEGFDKDWNYVGNKTEASYTNLDPGDYVFTVKASNNDGLWNETGASLMITILPAWYETVLFKVLLVFFIALILTGLYWWRVYRYQHRQTLLEQTVAEKTAELRAVNEELINLVATKDKFFSVMAHDIKNPFNAIMGFSEVLVEDYDDMNNDMHRELIQHIATASKNLYQLLENLLTWSRFQRGSLEFNPKPVELHAALDPVLGALLPTAVSKGVSLIDKVDDQSLYVMADPPMLDSILRNLINNALKFTPVGGQVTVSADARSEAVTISIADTGVGMTKEQVDRLFRIDTSTTTRGTNNEQGTGLGLILVHDFVSRQGGHILVDSQEGVGTTFRVELPRVLI